MFLGSVWICYFPGEISVFCLLKTNENLKFRLYLKIYFLQKKYRYRRISDVELDDMQKLCDY